MYLSLSLYIYIYKSLSLYMYMYMYVCICIYVCIYIYIYTHILRNIPWTWEHLQVVRAVADAAAATAEPGSDLELRRQLAANSNAQRDVL